ncbi:MAG TPA: hypothetical protein VMG39_10300 [Pseudolabrys sp.]|nr:hypothetical protein [Pseudolabrys sp.]HUI13441.1 hypothetical protein [Xanthobacteraceae bacterium]
MLRRPEAIGLAIVALFSISKVAEADAFDGTYRGMIVCEKLKTSQFMLRAPLDIIVNGKTAIAARPIFNLKGTLVVGSEIATGAVADDGTIKLSSNWKGAAAHFKGSYSGVLTNKGATLTGTQAWTTSEGEQQTRACTAAVVHTPS